MSTAMLPARLEEKIVVDPTSGCWFWTACTMRNGYGLTSLNGRKALAHRAAYELLVGPIPKGLQLDHLCRNRSCCNPEHLEPVTSRENSLRGKHPLYVTHLTKLCKRGHVIEGDNEYQRRCKACRLLAEARRAPRCRRRDGIPS